MKTTTVYEVRYSGQHDTTEKAMVLHSTHTTYLSAKMALEDAKTTMRENGNASMARTLTIVDRKVRVK